ncbi:MAG: sensor histidine kinase [Bacteroidales bacterium]
MNIYQKEFLNSQRNLSEVILDQERKDSEKYDFICENFANFFFAEAAVIYLPHQNRSGAFYLAGKNNRPDIIEIENENVKGDEIILEHSMKDSPMMQAMENRLWQLTKNLKEIVNDDSKWVEKIPQRKYIVENFEYVVSIPIIDPQGRKEIICGINLYYKKNKVNGQLPLFSELWRPIVEYLTQHTALLVAAIQSGRRRDEIIQNILRHEIKQTVDSVSEAADSLVKLIRRPIPSSIPSDNTIDYLRSRALTCLNDLEASRKILLPIAEMLRTENFKKLVESGLDPVLYLIKTKEKDLDLQTNLTSVNLRKLYFEIGKNLESLYRDKNIKYYYECENYGPCIRTNRIVIHRIFQNLLGNAAKYSLPNTKIIAIVSETDYSLHIKIQNIAPSIFDDEEYKIFKFGYRGSNIGSEKGEGLGLSYSRRLCEHLNGGLSLHLIKINNESSKFIFDVSFPIKIKK